MSGYGQTFMENCLRMRRLIITHAIIMISSFLGYIFYICCVKPLLIYFRKYIFILTLDHCHAKCAKLNHSNFYPLEVVSGYRNPQLRVGENYSYFCDETFANRDA